MSVEGLGMLLFTANGALANAAAAGAFFIEPHNLQWTQSPDLAAVAHTSTALFFAFIGVESGLSMSGEVSSPSRTVPRAILFGMLGIVALLASLELALSVASHLSQIAHVDAKCRHRRWSLTG